MSDVVMPAATEMTSWSAGTCGAISSSSPRHVLRLDGETSVSAVFAASAALTSTAMP